MGKLCFKCQKNMPINEFYKHSEMSDGTLNKCKSCCKLEAARRLELLKNDKLWVESEVLRHRLKAAKARQENRVSVQSKESVNAQKRDWAKKNKEKRKAHHLVNNSLRDGKIIKKACEVCGDNKSQAHHEDYSKPLEVIWLCSTHHNELHNEKRRKLRLGI